MRDMHIKERDIYTSNTCLINCLYSRGFRNFNTVPNKMCVWCEADDVDVPYTDFREGALWRRPCNTRPWNVPSPMFGVPGAQHENILGKDLFHICHLGAVRTFCVNLLCYLTWLQRFAASLHLQYLCFFGCNAIKQTSLLQHRF